MSASGLHLTCPLCGQDHQLIALAPGERALCRRCDTVLEWSERVVVSSRPCLELLGHPRGSRTRRAGFIDQIGLGRERDHRRGVLVLYRHVHLAAPRVEKLHAETSWVAIERQFGISGEGTRNFLSA